MNSVKSPKPSKTAAKESVGRVTRKGKGTDGRVSRKAKDPNAPKRALSAFMLFCSDKRAEIKAKNQTLKITEVSKECGRLWGEITAEDKNKYQKKAEDAKKVYEKAVKEYNDKK